MEDIKVVLRAGTMVSVEGPDGNLTMPFPLDGDHEASVFAMSDEWHIYEVNGVLHYVKADEDR